MLLSTEHLQTILIKKIEEINAWFGAKFKYLKENNIPLPIYSSFDLRDSGYKASIVDSNIFPSGFNNLDLKSRKYASNLFLKHLSLISSTKDILIIPENHTRNLHYFNNLNVLYQILNAAGFKTIFGYIENSKNDTKIMIDDNANRLKIEKIFRNGNKINTKTFKDGIILLNNDLSLKQPEILENINQQIFPSTLLGWYNRKKSTHFQFFNDLVEEFALDFSIEPWLLRTIFTHEDNIDFKEKKTIICLSERVDILIQKITKKYKKHKIDKKPFVFIKDNSGTYGLGIIKVSSGKEVLSLNSKNRKKMIFGKQRKRIKSVLIQEGIYTHYFIDNYPAEPVLYNVDEEVIGGFMRFNTRKDESTNLNTKGMNFDKLQKNPLTEPIIKKNGTLSLYEILAKIATLAIAREYKHYLNVK